ncbi:MAG TPA: ABC transporter ATP-binding protein, partial [Firmicutes bacterium]|nr:ABC transporter ATP-binding protein [Bacillota bacterium]
FLKEGNVDLIGEAETLRSEHGKSIDQLFREVYRC